MNKLKIFIITALALMPINVFAKSEIILDIDKNNVEANEEILVSAKLVSDTKLYALTATLSYDENVFEKINDSDFTSMENWSDIIYNPANNKFGLINKSGEVLDNLLNVRLKVKENCNVGDSKISLSNISASDGKSKYVFADSAVSVFVSRDAQEGENIPNNKSEEEIVSEEVEQKTDNNGPIIIGIEIVIILFLIICILSNLIKVKNKKKIIMFLLAIFIISVGILGCLFIINNQPTDVNKDGIKDYEDAKEIIKYLIDMEGTINSEKEDNNQINDSNSYLDNNNSSNNQDNYVNNNLPNNPSNNQTLIPDSKPNNNPTTPEDNPSDNPTTPENNPSDNPTTPDDKPSDNPTTPDDKPSDNPTKPDDKPSDNPTTPEDNPSDNPTKPDDKPSKPSKPNPGDVNHDGDVDINDAGDVVEDVTNQNYTVKLSEIKTKDVYYKQDEEITLNFNATINPSETIKKAFINDNYYDVINNTTYYSVILPSSIESGVKDYNISKVILSNKKEVNTNLKLQVEILKSEPSVKFFRVDEETKEISFEVIDEENTWNSGSLTITNTDGDVIFTDNVNVGKNNFNYNFNRDEKYFLNVNADYDLDTNTLNNITGNENLYSDTILLEKEICIEGVYDFKINSISITDIVTKNENPTIFFNSTNTSNYKPDYVIIDNQSYKVIITDKENEYKVILPSKNEYNSYPINIEEFILTNGKSFKNHEDFEINELFYNVLKSTPKVKDIELTYQKETNKIKASFNLNDPDHTISKLFAVLLDNNEEEIERIEIKDLTEVEFNYQVSDSYKLTVMFIADYDLGFESFSYQQQAIGQNNIFIEPSVYFTNVTSNKVYAQKNEEIYVYYELHVPTNFKPSGYPKNITNLITGMTINGLNYVATRNSEANELAKYTVSFKVPNESGPLKIKANKINFFDSSIYLMDPMILNIEVLKDKPVIKNFRLENESYDQKEATFSFDVVSDQGGFDSGYITLGSEKGSEKIDIHNGSNTVTFSNIPLDEKINIEVYGNYDLDTNSLDNENNYYRDDQLFSFEYGLYNPTNYEDISLSNVNPNQIYYQKNEDITLNFLVNGLEDFAFDVAKLNVLDTYYDITKNENNYSVKIKGFNNAGVKHFVIYDLLLTNGKKITLKQPIEVNLEILKDKVEISNFIYQINDENIDLEIYLNDPDNSLKNKLRVNIVDENDELVGNYEYLDKITFNKNNDVTRYYVKAYVDYDLDENTLTTNDNYYSNVLVLDEVISLDKNSIELKEITDITLYKENQIIEKVNISDLENNLNNYFVQIKMSNMPTIYSKIKNILKENDHLFLILDNNNEQLKIDFGKITNNYAENTASPETFEDLIKRLKENPDKTFDLDHDYDASTFDSETNTLTDIDFTGTINGNNHSIKNLRKPLFKSINNGEIKNIKLVNVILNASNAHGSFADKATNTKFSNILIEGFEKTNSDNTVGSIIGEATNCEINTSKVSGFKMSSGIYNSQLGGLAGIIRNTVINNCYFNGSISGGWQNLGGIVGNADDKSSINNCYSKGSIVNSFGYAGYLTLGGIAGSSGGTFNNNISLITTEYGYGIAQITNNTKANNNYQLPNMGYTLNENEGFNTINKENINKDFFTNNAHFSEDIWDFNNISFDNLPTLKIEFSLNNEVLNNELYDQNKDMLYHNLSLLTPFYDYSKIVKNGSIIDPNHILNKEEIKHLIPLDNNGNIVTYLTKSDYRKISKIKLILSNDDVLEYNVRYDNLYDMIASYRINELKIDYTYNHYVIDESSNVVNQLTTYLTSLDYTKDLDPLTTTKDSRLYRDYYNEVTKNELKEFVLKYLSNSGNNITLNDDNVGNYIINDLKKDNKLKKVLYVYNYFRRFYSFSINNVMFNDLIFFNSNGFNKILNPDDITNIYLNNENNFNTNATNDTYNKTLAKYTNINNIPYLIEYFVTKLSDETPDVWFKNTFKGILIEVGAKGNDEITYTMWSHLRHSTSAWYNHTLVLLTMPSNSAYIISSPTQFLIGSQRTYVKDPTNPADKEILMNKINEYATNIENYFTTAATIINDAKYFNAIHTITLDNRFTLDSNGKQVYQSKEYTEEPFHKNFNEAVNLWKEMDGNAATSNGLVVFFNAYTALSAYPTWTHEMAHNFDARLFLKNNGRRYDAGGEDYSDGNLAQRWGEGDINMNLTYDFEEDKFLATNLTRERINSPDKIQDFYRKEFEAIYILDYIEAQAFLNLTSEQQSAVATEVYYPNIDNETERLKYKVTGYRQIDAEKIKEMKLTTINDLYDNHLVIYPGVKTPISYGDNKYGTENIFRTRWYQAYNNYGRPDSYTLKFFAYEMLGYAGYDDGYIEYYSNINNNGDKDKTKTDLMALRKITKNPDITFDSYRKGRFEEIKNKLKYVQYIDVNQVFKDFYNALVEDAKNNDRDLKTRREVRKDAFFKMKMGSNDFRKEIIDSTNPQEIDLTK